MDAKICKGLCEKDPSDFKIPNSYDISASKELRDLIDQIKTKRSSIDKIKSQTLRIKKKDLTSNK